MAQAQLKSQTRAPRDWPFEIKPLHPVLGCEITGITLEQAVSPALFAKVYEAFLDYEVILFRDVDLPPATQVAFARNFGEVQVHVLSQLYGYKDHPEIYMLSNLDKDGNPSGKHPDRGTLYWHTDGSWKERTGQATMMYSEIVPDEGGETEFADMYSAYELLPAATRTAIEGRNAIHNFDFSRTRRHGEDPLTAEQKAKVPPIAHPIVRTHPQTGRKAIFLGDHAEYIEGMDYDEGRAHRGYQCDGHAAGARLYAPLGAAPMHRVGQPLHAAPRHRFRRGALEARDAPLHHRRRQADLNPACLHRATQSGLYRVSAVDGDCRTGNEIRSRSGQEDRNAGKIIRLAPQYLFVKAFDLFARLLCEFGIDPAWQDRVDLDVVLRPGDRHRSRHLHDAALARRIWRGI
jgi:taurine dioxygenase